MGSFTLLKFKWQIMKKPLAIVLAGNAENRVAQTYYGMPQELHTAKILSSMGLETYITERSELELECEYKILGSLYEGKGAIHAIISLLNDEGAEAALLVPCDMPLIDAEIIKQLLDTYQDEDTIVCFRQSGTPYIEPFPAIFEKALLELLVTDVMEGKITLQDLLKHAGSNLIELPKDDRLLNVADDDERTKIIELLKA